MALLPFFSLEKKKVLIIDDFAEMRSLLRSMIITFNPEVIDVASNGKDAIQAISRHKYDIIFCDYDLGPGKSGSQVLEEVKHSNILSPQCIFFIITAETKTSWVMGAIEYQPDGYITKPFTKATLKSRIEKIFSKKERLAKIEGALSNKRLLEAAKFTDEAIKSTPKNLLELLQIKGDLMINLGNWQEARKTYEQILNIREFPWASLGLGKALFNLGDHDAAEEIFQTLINKHENYLEAYDWMAKLREQQDATDEAQNTLNIAVKKSPKSILRQKAFAQVANDNGDYQAAESAYKKVLDLGRFSCFKSPSDYTGLAKACMNQNKNKEALDTVSSIAQEFENDSQAQLEATIAESQIHHHSGDEEKASKALGKASEMYQRQGSSTSSETAVELAQALFQQGKDEEANAILEKVIQNNHTNDALLKKITKVYKQAGKEDEGRAFIEKARGEVIHLNNEGVKLARSGDLKGAIDFLEKAVTNLPGNETINLNAAQVIIFYLERNSHDESLVKKCKSYLRRAEEINPSSEIYQKLSSRFKSYVKNSKAIA